MQPWDLFKLIKDTKYDTAGDDIDYKVIVKDGRAVLLFQESTTKRDWQNNFDFPRKLYKDQDRWLLIHRGYGDAWRTANDKIMTELKAAAEIAPGVPLIAGWSFGGAMAQLAAEDFNYRTNIRPDVVTFGAPKVAGDIKTRNVIRSCGNFAQYANVNDVVTICPPLPWFYHINKIKVGQPGCISNLFNPEVYHCEYGNPAIYGGKE